MLCFAQRSAFCKKIFVLFVFFVKYLGYLYTRKVFGKIGVYIRCSVLYCAVCLSGKFTEYPGEQHNERNKAQHHKCKLVIEDEHCREHAQNNEHVFNHSYQNMGKHHGNGIGVVGNTGNQLAHGNVIKLVMRKAFYVCEQILAKRRKYLLTGFLQNNCLKIGTHHRDNQNCRINSDLYKQRTELELFYNKLFDITYDNRRDNIVSDGKQHY